MFEMKIARLDAPKAKKTVVLFTQSGNRLLAHAQMFDLAFGGVLGKALKQGRFSGEFGETRLIDTPGLNGVNSVLVVGLGAAGKLHQDSFRQLGVKAGHALNRCGCKQATVVLEPVSKAKLDYADMGVEFVEGMHLALYRYTEMRTNLRPAEQVQFEKLTVMAERSAYRALQEKQARIEGLFAGVNTTRDMVNRPANYMHPTAFEEAAKELEKLGVEVEVLRNKELKAAGLNLLLSVNAGSNHEARLIIMRWKGAGAKKPFRALVGKGVTFDTGGYSIKPSDGMVAMKSDMAGGAAVLGTMKALALRQVKANVVGVVGAVENLISSAATRPSDVFTSYKGLTVEVNNTDAEGRLVLADALAYIIDKAKPVEVVDIATLTGACMIALGSGYGGLFSNSERLASRLQNAGAASGEPLWRLPLAPIYHQALKSKVADVSNIGGRAAGASTAACFLEKFVGSTKWAHLDIAGVAMADKMMGAPSLLELDGASGFGARLLVRYIEDSAGE